MFDLTMDAQLTLKKFLSNANDIFDRWSGNRVVLEVVTVRNSVGLIVDGHIHVGVVKMPIDETDL